MLTAGFSQQDKRKFWCEVISTATKLDNIMNLDIARMGLVDPRVGRT